MLDPAGVKLSRLQIDKFLPWTLTQIGTGLFVASLYVPVEYAVTYLLYFFLSCQCNATTSCPHTHIHTHPPPFFLRNDRFGYGTVLSLCLEANRCKLVGSSNLWRVTSGSPLHLFLPSASLWGCHAGSDRWRRKEGENALLKSAYVCVCVRVCAHTQVMKYISNLRQGVKWGEDW